ncbi:DUF2637 domain-containing protein [Streptomyces cavernae]|uniref:DUF2637 domain-containing protein n=1 Tax=Streptomyces cavernae TaxID=2259034 RepID=UPI001EE4C752|nr:DUF2637 domain-containing protein [Streptomyces cavernae]
MYEGYSSALTDGQGDNLYDAWLNSPRFSGDVFADGQPMAAVHGMDVPQWDPAEELAYLLRGSMLDEPSVDLGVHQDEPTVTATLTQPVVGTAQPVVGTAPPVAGVPQPAVGTSQPVVGVDHTCTRPPGRPPYPAPAGHRRARRKLRIVSLLRTASFSIGALSAVIVAMVSVFGGIVAYAPLRDAATDYELSADVVRWWPLLVYGPWMVASLSILRAALHRRRAVHSWCVVLFFCCVAVLLCVVQAPRTVTGMAAACLPSLAALTCFQQLVRQITLTKPPRQTAPRHRQGTPRHRQSTASPAHRHEEAEAARQEQVAAHTQGCPAHPNGAVTSTLPRHHSTSAGLGVGGRAAGLRMQ